MKQQVVFLGGGTPKENYTDFYEYLHQQDYDPYEEPKVRWKNYLGKHLWGDCDYFIIPFPNKHFADYDAWKIVFEKHFEYFEENMILIAHSLWSSFLSKYVCENTFPVCIKKLFFLAPAFYDNIPVEKLWAFTPDTSQFWKINKLCDKVYLYHSIDDPIVKFSDSEEYWKLFPHAIFRKFEDRWHLNWWERFQELEKDIKNH